MSQNSSFDPFSMSANKHFTVAQTYRIPHEAARTIRHLGRFRKAHGKPFPQRIMLAVTEVNGCAMCAYAHTKFALEAGMDADEVREMLGGVSEGAPDKELPAIAFAQQGVTPPRPLTHDLFRDVLEATGQSLVEVRITDMQEGVFYAQLVFDGGAEVSARPSDSIALALRTGTRIVCAEGVLDEAGLAVPAEQEDEVERFREFLDHVSPEDFEAE